MKNTAPAVTDYQSLKDQRLRVMKGILAWEGTIGNARVRELFGVQLIQASRLMADFRTMMGTEVANAGRAKALVAMRPELLRTDITLDEYLALTHETASNAAVIIDARLDLTRIAPHVFAILRQAAIGQYGAEVEYGSMSNPVPNRRRIYPHAMVKVGRRWHLRAWCAKHEEFRDFNLGRIRDCRALPGESAPFTQDQDNAWTTDITLHLAAHHMLAADQQLIVRQELFGGNAGFRLSVRQCLVQYVIQDLRAALMPEKQTPPEYQIEVTNADALKNILFT